MMGATQVDGVLNVRVRKVGWPTLQIQNDGGHRNISKIIANDETYISFMMCLHFEKK